MRCPPSDRGRLAATIIGGLVLVSLSGATTPVLAEPSISVRTQRVLLPLVDEEDLDLGWIETDGARGRFACEILVESPLEEGPWALYVRADGSSFTRGAVEKPCSDLAWKLDEAPASAYIPLETEDALVLVASKGGNARVTLDVRVRLDWSTESGPLGLGVLFRVASY